MRLFYSFLLKFCCLCGFLICMIPPFFSFWVFGGIDTLYFVVFGIGLKAPVFGVGV